MHTLDIFLGDRRVGTITNLDNDHNVFVFDPAYVADHDRPILSLGFFSANGELAATTRPHLRLPAFFANLLPEGHLREYLAERARGNPTRDFPLLWLLGEDLPRAVIASPPTGSGDPPSEPEDVVVSARIQNDPTVLKFSLAGVQLKFSAIRDATGGLTIPVHGKDGKWILKMPSATYPLVPENEYTILTF